MKEEITSENELEELETTDEKLEKKFSDNAKLNPAYKRRLKIFKQKKHLQGISPSRLAWLRARGKV